MMPTILEPNPMRKNEIQQLMQLTSEDVKRKAGSHLIVCINLDQLHQQFAADIAQEIQNNNQHKLPTRIILPIGPYDQYPYLAKLITQEHLRLDHCWFFFMDEYCDDKGQSLPPSHPLSFKGIVNRFFLNQLEPETGINLSQIFFPNESNLDDIVRIITKIGGIDTCYGGIGIHGHLAFNEPESGVSQLGPRKVKLNVITLTINAIRAQVGGDLENFPREAFTIGMKQILAANRIHLYCRNGTPYDWANTVLRIALFGAPGDDYPVTYIRTKDYVITTDFETLKQPNILLK
jgi:glucosamine-6-phosphate deaminase